MHVKTVQQLVVVDKADTHLQATGSVVGHCFLRICNLGSATEMHDFEASLTLNDESINKHTSSLWGHFRLVRKPLTLLCRILCPSSCSWTWWRRQRTTWSMCFSVVPTHRQTTAHHIGPAPPRDTAYYNHSYTTSRSSVEVPSRSLSVQSGNGSLRRCFIWDSPPRLSIAAISTAVRRWDDLCSAWPRGEPSHKSQPRPSDHDQRVAGWALRY